ncbi:hypothetical protein BKA64DRAFT_639254 [Cadophora sp. MPI-SDFR-AT-0126]|nr:hypothetical protein BKA64DRAFT_639254 [Leotiomycetes sp. MPI-SDFR-AT-0126]
MASTIPITKEAALDSMEEFKMDEMETTHEEGLKKREYKNKTDENGIDRIGISNCTAQDPDLLDKLPRGRTTCKSSRTTVNALNTLHKNRHSDRTRKDISTYNVKALTGIAIRIPKRFRKGEKGQVKANSSTHGNVSALLCGQSLASARSNSRSTNENTSNADLPPPSSIACLQTSMIGQKDIAVSIASSTSHHGGPASKVGRADRSETISTVPCVPHFRSTSKPPSLAPHKSAMIEHVRLLPTSNSSLSHSFVAIAPKPTNKDALTAESLEPSGATRLNVSKTIEPPATVAIAPQAPPPASITFRSLKKLHLKYPTYPQLFAAAETTRLYVSTTSTVSAAASSSNTAERVLEGTAASVAHSDGSKKSSSHPFGRIKLVIKSKGADNGAVTYAGPRKPAEVDDASEIPGSADRTTEEIIATPSSSHHKGEASQNVSGGRKKEEAPNAKINGSVGLKRAAPVDSNQIEPPTKKHKMQAVTSPLRQVSSSLPRNILLTLYRFENVILYLTSATPDATHSMLTEEQVVANSAVLKHILSSKASPDEEFDPDDELCFNPATSKNHQTWAMDCQAVFIIPLLKAMLGELDDELPNLDKSNKENRSYLQDLVKTPSDKIWELVQTWQGWIESGEVKLGRCPFQKERMLKFARVMEMPIEFFRAVQKHEVDKKRFPTEHECEMWKNGLHPEQYVDKEDKELKEYWSPIGGHIHEYYEKGGR